MMSLATWFHLINKGSPTVVKSCDIQGVYTLVCFLTRFWRRTDFFVTQIVRSLESNNSHATYHKLMIRNQGNLSMNVVNQCGEKQNGFAEVTAFCHVTQVAGTSTVLYYKELIEIGAKPAIDLT